MADMHTMQHNDKKIKARCLCEARAFELDGSPGRIRTGDLSINSRMLYR